MFVILMVVVGLAILTAGAELLVRSASAIAAAVGISPLVVGLTVVAYGTSAPELVVSVQSALSGKPDLALGNVVGSNIFNVLFILGISALIIPLKVAQKLVRFDVPLMIVLSIAVMAVGYDGRISRLDGSMFTAGLVAYTVWAIISSRRNEAAIKAEYDAEFGVKNEGFPLRQSLWNGVLLIVGLGLLVFGSRLFVGGAIAIARNLGISELVIGLTIVAAGTSLPEVATSIIAALRGERDIAVGNVVGSNLFNIMGVLGISSLISSEGIAISDTAFRLDLPVMVAVAAACLPIFFTGHLIARWEGALFLVYYVLYTTLIVISARIPEHANTYAKVVLMSAIPLTVLGLAASLVRHLRPTTDR